MRLHNHIMCYTHAGTKTFTVFAPTDAAFVEAATKNGGTPIWQESDGPEAAKEIVLRHVIPTTMYTAGMRYYHQKETLRAQAPVQIQKTGGKSITCIYKLNLCFSRLQWDSLSWMTRL